MSSIANDNPTIKEKKRIEYVDLAKGVCISLVVLSHSFQTLNFENNMVNYIILSFHMPLFFLISGFFFRTYSCNTVFIKRKTNQLLVPFFAFYVLFSLILPNILDCIDGKFNWHHFIKCLYGWCTSSFFNQTTWFLLALFFVNCLFLLIYNISIFTKNAKNFLLAASIICGIIGYYLGINKINIPFYIDTAFSAVPFFALGYIIKNYSNQLGDNTKKWILFIYVILLSTLFLIPADCGKLLVLISNRYYVNPMIGYLCGISGTLVVLLICKLIGKCRYISFIGRYSIMILLTHQVILKIIKRYWIDVFTDKILGSIICFVFTMAVCTCLIPLMKKYIPKLTAQEDLIK